MDLESIRSQYFPALLPANVIARSVNKATAFEVGAATRIFTRLRWHVCGAAGKTERPGRRDRGALRASWG